MNSATAKPKPCRTLQPQTEDTTASPRLFRILQAAKYMGSTPWFVRTLIWSNEIPHVHLGRRHLVDRRDLDAYIERTKVGKQ